MKVHMMKDEDFSDLMRRIELYYRKRCEKENQPWATSFMHDDPRGVSIYDQFKGTWYEICTWARNHEIDAVKKFLDGK